MIGLDTNVLVRYLTQDDAEQARRANALVEESAASGIPLRLSLVVLCELVWVLRAAYGLDKETIVGTLEKLLDTAQFDVEAKDVSHAALEDFRRGKGDFADYVIARQNQDAGCTETVTFDVKLVDRPLFRVLGRGQRG